MAGPNVVPKAYEVPETSPWKVTVADAPNELTTPRNQEIIGETFRLFSTPARSGVPA